MKLRLAPLPLLIVLSAVPALRAVARAQEDAAPSDKDGDAAAGEEKPAASDERTESAAQEDAVDAPDAAKHAEDAETPKAGSSAVVKGYAEKPLISIQVIGADGDEGPAVARPKARKKSTKLAKRAAAKGRAKTASAEAPESPRKPLVLPPPAVPPPPSPIPLTRIEPWNP